MTIILYDRRFTVCLCLLSKQPQARRIVIVLVLTDGKKKIAKCNLKLDVFFLKDT